MAVIRVNKTADYTVMSNTHFKEREMSLKAKGLLSLMLSLPDDWDYSVSGLVTLSKDGKNSVMNALAELEELRYLRRTRSVDEKGCFSGYDYDIYETPYAENPNTENPYAENPNTENPYAENPNTENPPQLNTNKSSTKKLNTNKSNPILSNEERIGMEEIDAYREIIKENIEYDILISNSPYDKTRIDEIVELLTETICTSKDYLTIAGDDYPAQLVKSKLLKLGSEHINYVLEGMKRNTSDVRNIRKYLLAVLFNAPSTIDSYYSAKVNHDLHG